MNAPSSDAIEASISTLGEITDRTRHLLSLREDPRRFLNLPGEPFYILLCELQDIFMGATVEYWRSRGARYLFLPITTNAVSSPMGLGSESTPVKISLQGVQTYLADSMQFLLEYGCRLSNRGVYYVMPSFRGEKLDRTHLSQFTHMEAELPSSLTELVVIINTYILHVCERIVEAFAEAKGARTLDLSHLHKLLMKGQSAFQIASFDEVVAAIGDTPENVRTVAPGARTLTNAGQRRAMSVLGEFLWICEWDHLAVPFYQRMLSGERGTKAKCADLLFGSGEIVGAGERHKNGNDVRTALRMHNIDADDYLWYIELKEKFPLVTSGFGLGVDRFLMWVLGHSDIRDLQILLRENGVLHIP